MPAIGLAAALVRAGHDATVWSGTEHARTARFHGVELAPAPTLPADDREHDLGYRLWGRAPEHARELAARLARRRPDVVVADTLVPAAALAAQLLGVPTVELVPHHLPDPAGDLPPVGLRRRPARSIVRRMDDRRIHHAQLRSIALGRAQARTAARALGLRDAERPVVRLIATAPALERPRRCWPGDAHIVGALAVDPALPELEAPEGDEPLVLVTDSTATTVSRSIGAVALVALEHAPVRLAVTSGALEPSVRDRVVVGRGPHGPLLRAASLAVGPGGGGFVAKVVGAGIPMVTVPLAGDQREAAARLVDVGVGRTLPPHRLTARRLRWAVLRHLFDRTAQRRALELRAEMAQLGPDLAAKLVLSVAAGAEPHARGPDHHVRRSPSLATPVVRSGSAGTVDPK